MTSKAFWFVRTKTTYEPSVPVVAGDQDTFNRNVAYAFSGLVGGYGNAGDLLYRATDKAIAGYILCDGSAVSRTSYKELFDAIGDTWGVGDGTTTFNIPDQAGLSGLVATPPPTPAQTVDNSTVASGTAPASPTTPGQAGGTTGGQVDSGGSSAFYDNYYNGYYWYY